VPAFVTRAISSSARFSLVYEDAVTAKAECFLNDIQNDMSDVGNNNSVSARMVIAVAHPDDETIGCSALLQRRKPISVLHATDGAPRDMIDARGCGFATPPAYAIARSRELAAAMALWECREKG
jgi:hypothetical protein